MVRPGRNAGDHHSLYGALRAARRDGKGHAGPAAGTMPGRVLVGDGLTYDFVVRKGAKFHNNEPVTAEDVKFSFERYHGAAHELMKENVAAIEAPDPQHVRFKL